MSPSKNLPPKSETPPRKEFIFDKLPNELRFQIFRDTLEPQVVEIGRVKATFLKIFYRRKLAAVSPQGMPGLLLVCTTAYNELTKHGVNEGYKMAFKDILARPVVIHPEKGILYLQDMKTVSALSKKMRVGGAYGSIWTVALGLKLEFCRIAFSVLDSCGRDVDIRKFIKASGRLTESLESLAKIVPPSPTTLLLIVLDKRDKSTEDRIEGRHDRNRGRRWYCFSTYDIQFVSKEELDNFVKR